MDPFQPLCVVRLRRALHQQLGQLPDEHPSTNLPFFSSAVTHSSSEFIETNDYC